MAVKRLIYTSLFLHLKVFINQKHQNKLTYLNNKIINLKHQDEKSPTPLESAPNFRPAVCGVCWSSVVPQGGHRRPGNLSPIVALDLSRAGRRRLADLPTCRLADLVVDDQRDSGPRILLRLQFRRFLNLQENYRGLRLKPRLRHPPTLPKPQQLSKGLFRCHRSPSSSTRQPPFPMETARNRGMPLF